VGKMGHGKNGGFYSFSMEKETKLVNFGRGFLVYNRIISAVKIAELFSDRMSYKLLIGRWCNIILNMLAQ
jgi:hypothetical protein